MGYHQSELKDTTNTNSNSNTVAVTVTTVVAATITPAPPLCAEIFAEFHEYLWTRFGGGRGRKSPSFTITQAVEALPSHFVTQLLPLTQGHGYGLGVEEEHPLAVVGQHNIEVGFVVDSTTFAIFKRQQLILMTLVSCRCFAVVVLCCLILFCCC